MMKYIFQLILYILSIFIYDGFNIFPMVGVIAAYCLVSNRKVVISSDKSIPIRTRAVGWSITAFVVFVIMYEFFCSYYLRIFQRPIFELGNISVGKITIVNTFVVVLEVVFSIIYYAFLRKCNAFKVNKHALMFIIVMLVAFIIRDCAFAGFDVFFSGNTYDVLECLNLSYRALILAAFTEEFVYRGVIYDEMKVYFKPIAAGVIQALLFTLVHSERWISLLVNGDIYIAVNLLMVFFMGMLCAFLREKTGSIIPGILVHFALNGGVYNLFLALFCA